MNPPRSLNSKEKELLNELIQFAKEENEQKITPTNPLFQKIDKLHYEVITKLAVYFTEESKNWQNEYRRRSYSIRTMLFLMMFMNLLSIQDLRNNNDKDWRVFKQVFKEGYVDEKIDDEHVYIKISKEWQQHFFNKIKKIGKDKIAKYIGKEDADEIWKKYKTGTTSETIFRILWYFFLVITGIIVIIFAVWFIGLIISIPYVLAKGKKRKYMWYSWMALLTPD